VYLSPMSPRRPPPSPAPTPLAPLLQEHGFVLLYDGVCGLCNRTVRWILRHDRDGAMRFAPLDSAIGREARRLLPSLAGVDSVILLHRDGAWVKSTAVLEIARYVGGPWRLALIGYLLPRALRDWMYDRVARVRYRVFGRYDACPLPPPEQRQRFLGA